MPTLEQQLSLSTVSDPAPAPAPSFSTMSRFLNTVWGQTQQLTSLKSLNNDESDDNNNSSDSTGAASWISMSDPPLGARVAIGGREGEPVMAVNKVTVKTVLEPLGNEEAVNVVAIFGAARGGKSFLLNQLVGRDGTFKISNAKV